MTKQFFLSKRKRTLIEYPHLGTQSLQLNRQSTYYRNQVASLSVKLKYQMYMISKTFSRKLIFSSDSSCLIEKFIL